MAKLKGYLSTQDHSRIATIATDKLQKKKLELTKNDSKNAAQMAYLRPCLSHENTARVAVDLMVYAIVNGSKAGWVKEADAICCPMCWTILQRTDVPH